MPLPSLAKTWQYNVNQQIAAQGTALATNRRHLRTIKNGLIGFGTNPWTTRYSCNSVTAGSAGDGVDRWSADADLVWANQASAHSWYVLRQTGIASNFELLLVCSPLAANGQNMTVAVSPSAGFTGGSTTARPTATDEIVIINGVTWGSTDSTDNNLRLHMWQSTDGQATRIVTCRNGVNVGFWLFDKVSNPVTGWSTPSITMCVAAAGAECITQANTYTSAKMNGRGSASFTMFCTQESSNNAALNVTQTAANDFDANFPIMPIGLFSTAASHRGRHGQVFDLWWGLTAHANGTTYPGDGTKTFLQLGSLVFPWNGSTPVLT